MTTDNQNPTVKNHNEGYVSPSAEFETWLLKMIVKIICHKMKLGFRQFLGFTKTIARRYPLGGRGMEVDIIWMGGLPVNLLAEQLFTTLITVPYFLYPVATPCPPWLILKQKMLCF